MRFVAWPILAALMLSGAFPAYTKVVLVLPVEQTKPVPEGVEWASVIPAASQAKGVDDCDRPVLIHQTKSLNGGFVYQEVCHWVTSDEIVQIRLSDGHRRSVGPGNSLSVIRDGPWRGYLLTQRHEYRPAGGSYDATWVVRPDGKKMFAVPGSAGGEDEVVQRWLMAHGWHAY